MPSKFPRRKCIICRCYHVSWKMPSMADDMGNRRIFFCWDCAQKFFTKLQGLHIQRPPNKKFLLSQAFRIPKPKKAENSVEAYDLFKKHFQDELKRNNTS